MHLCHLSSSFHLKPPFPADVTVPLPPSPPIPPPPPTPRTCMCVPAHLEFPVLLAVRHTFSFCKFSSIVSPRHSMRAHPAPIRGLHESSPNLVQPRPPTPLLAIISLVLDYLCDTRKGGITENAPDRVPGYLMPLMSPAHVMVWTMNQQMFTRTPCCVYLRPWKHERTLGTCAVPQSSSLHAHTI